QAVLHAHHRDAVAGEHQDAAVDDGHEALRQLVAFAAGDLGAEAELTVVDAHRAELAPRAVDVEHVFVHEVASARGDAGIVDLVERHAVTEAVGAEERLARAAEHDEHAIAGEDRRAAHVAVDGEPVEEVPAEEIDRVEAAAAVATARRTYHHGVVVEHGRVDEARVGREAPHHVARREVEAVDGAFLVGEDEHPPARRGVDGLLAARGEAEAALAGAEIEGAQAIDALAEDRDHGDRASARDDRALRRAIAAVSLELEDGLALLDVADVDRAAFAFAEEPIAGEREAVAARLARPEDAAVVA